MAKAALIVFADTETPEGLGRAVNALVTAKEFNEAGDEAVVVFDGAGSRAVAALSDPEHDYHGLLQETQELVAGACAYCSNTFGMREQLEQSLISPHRRVRGRSERSPLRHRGV